MKQTKRFWCVLGGLFTCSDSAFAGTLGFGNGPTDLAFQGIVIGALSTLLVVLMVNLAWSFFRTGENEASSPSAPKEAPAPPAIQYVAVPQFQAFPVMQPFWGQPPMAPHPSYPQQAPQTAGYPFPYPPGEVDGTGDGNRRDGRDAQDTGAEIRRREDDPAREASRVAPSDGNQPHFDELLRSAPSKNSTKRNSPTSSRSAEARGLFDQIVRQNIQIREGLEKENPLASSKGAK